MTSRGFIQAVVVVVALSWAAPTAFAIPPHERASDHTEDQAPTDDLNLIDLATRGAMQDSQLRATLRGLSLELYSQARLIVAHDPQWMMGPVSRLNPAVRSPRERVTRRRFSVTAASRLMQAFVEIRDRLSLLGSKHDAKDNASPITPALSARAWSVLRRPMHGARSSLASVARLGEPHTAQGSSRGSQWVWGFRPLARQTRLDVESHLSVAWVPWRPRGPPASSPQTLRQDATP